MKIGYLVPLNRNLEEDNSVPKLPISSGSNVIGRNSISLPDKRLSRKHLTLVAAVDGSTDLVVVRSLLLTARLLSSYNKYNI